METDMQDITVLNDVVFAFHPDQSFVAGRSHGSGGMKSGTKSPRRE